MADDPVTDAMGPIYAHGNCGSTDVVIVFPGLVTAVDATRFVVVPEVHAVVKHAPDVYFARGCDKSDGLNYDDVGAPNPGTSFVGPARPVADGSATELTVRMQSELADPPDPNGFAIRVFSGAVSPNVEGCVRVDQSPPEDRPETANIHGGSSVSYSPDSPLGTARRTTPSSLDQVTLNCDYEFDLTLVYSQRSRRGTHSEWAKATCTAVMEHMAVTGEVFYNGEPILPILARDFDKTVVVGDSHADPCPGTFGTCAGDWVMRVRFNYYLEDGWEWVWWVPQCRQLEGDPTALVCEDGDETQVRECQSTFPNRSTVQGGVLAERAAGPCNPQAKRLSGCEWLCLTATHACCVSFR